LSNREHIFFDLTLLTLRAGFRRPTGIGRVELAYGRHLLDHFPDSVRFLVALPQMVQIIPTAVAARYIRATELAWKEYDAGANQVASALGNFLGVDHVLFSGALAQRDPPISRRTERLMCAADVMMRAALDRVRPVGLARFSNAPFRSAYINVSGSGIDSPWLTSWLARSPSIASVFLLHDIIPITHPEYVRPKSHGRHRRYVQRLTGSGGVVLTNSVYTRDTLATFVKEAGQTMPTTIVAPLGIDSGFAQAQTHDCAVDPYFVFVSTIEPRKNHHMLLSVWERLVARFGAKAPKLVLVGTRGWKNASVLDSLEISRKLGTHVLECSNLCDRALIPLISNSRATLFPSRVEGYGLPLAESLALRAPVICSDIPSFREIAGRIPEYLDPQAGADWARIVMDYAAPNSTRRAEQLRRVETYHAPTWKNHFSIMQRVLATLGIGEVIDPANKKSLVEQSGEGRSRWMTDHDSGLATA
jgi:glycosyltransferase involved in cell wall biosynthesis